MEKTLKLPYCPCKEATIDCCTSYDLPYRTYTCGEGQERVAPSEACKLQDNMNQGHHTDGQF